MEKYKDKFCEFNEIELIFDLPFKKRRGRLNCTLPAAKAV